MGGESGDTSARVSMLTAQLDSCVLEREILEKRMDARLATLAEFDLVKLQTARRTERNLHARRAALSERSAAVLRNAALCSSRARDTLAGKPLLTLGDASKKQSKDSVGALCNSRSKLTRAKQKYRAAVEKIYPSWQDRLERDGIRRLEAIKRRMEAVNERREFARAVFDKETALRTMMVEQENDLEQLERAERAEMLARARERTRLDQAARLAAVANDQQRAPQYRQLHVLTGASQAAGAGREPASPPVPPKSPKVIESSRTLRDGLPRRAGDTSPPVPPKSPRVRAAVSGSNPASAVSPTGSAFSGGAQASQQLPADFVLSYAWQAVPLGAALPGQTEQTLSVDDDMQRLARIPASWSLRVAVGEHPASSVGGAVAGLASPAAVGIQVEKSLTLGALVARVREHPAVRERIQGRRLQLLLDGSPLLNRQEEDSNQGNARTTVQAMGARLFTGSVTARFLGAVIRSTASPNRAASARRGLGVTGMDWSLARSGLTALIARLQSRAAYGELRGCKYGLVGDSDEDYSPFEVQDTVRKAMDMGAVGLHEHRVERVCLAVKAVLKQHASGLLPLSAFGESGAIGRLVMRGERLDVRVVTQEVARYHAACGDHRDQLWAVLLKHWHWLVNERVLSRDQVGAVFVGAFLRPGDRDTSDLATAIRSAIKELTSSNVLVQDDNAPPRSPGTGGGHPRLAREQSYDELLGGSPSRQQQGEEMSKDISTSSNSKQQKRVEEDDSESEEEEIVASVVSPMQQARTRQMPGLLEQVLAESKPDLAEVEAGELDDGDEFDF